MSCPASPRWATLFLQYILPHSLLLLVRPSNNQEKKTEQKTKHFCGSEAENFSQSLIEHSEQNSTLWHSKGIIITHWLNTPLLSTNVLKCPLEQEGPITLKAIKNTPFLISYFSKPDRICATTQTEEFGLTRWGDLNSTKNGWQHKMKNTFLIQTFIVVS